MKVVTGRRPVLEALRAGMVMELLIADNAQHTPAMRAVLQAADEVRIEPKFVDRARLDEIAADNHGVLARTGELGAETLDERDIEGFDFEDDAFVVVLDGITDPQNFGAAARSAEASGAAMLITRTKRSADVTGSAVRASAGALLHIPLAKVTNISRTLEQLKDRGFFVVGLAGEAESSVFDEPCPQGQVAVVLGAEGEGISRLVREHCDLLVSLPMKGQVGSLNASASLAAALWSYVLPSRTGN